MSNCSQMCVKIVIISNDYCDIGQLLLLTIIVSSKNWTISIIVKEDITVNRQNRSISQPYCHDGKIFIIVQCYSRHEQCTYVCCCYFWLGASRY